LLQDTHTQWFVCGGSDLGDEWNREGQEIYKLKVKVMTGARLLIPGSSLHRSEGESPEKNAMSTDDLFGMMEMF
jgi:hypothetical protein